MGSYTSGHTGAEIDLAVASGSTTTGFISGSDTKPDEESYTKNPHTLGLRFVGFRIFACWI